MRGAGGEVEPEGRGMKKLAWIVLALVAWANAERRAAQAEERARDAEQWAEAVEAEAEMWLDKAGVKR